LSMFFSSSSSSNSKTGVWTLDRQALYHLSRSTSPFSVEYFLRQGLLNHLPGLALKCDLLDLCLLSS
jgi:hypothetical protein